MPITLKLRKFSERLPDLGRTVTVFTERNIGFDFFGTETKEGKVVKFEDDEYGKACLAVDTGNYELVISTKDYKGEIDLDNYWIYSDDLYPKMYPKECFYQDWPALVKKGRATVKCRKVVKSTTKYGEKRIFTYMVFTMKRTGKKTNFTLVNGQLHQITEMEE